MASKSKAKGSKRKKSPKAPKDDNEEVEEGDKDTGEEEEDQTEFVTPPSTFLFTVTVLLERKPKKKGETTPSVNSSRISTRW